MLRFHGRTGHTLGLVTVFALLAFGLTSSSRGQGLCGPVWTVDALTKLSPAMLDDVYRQGVAGCVPVGKVRGTALVSPGSPINPIASKVSRVFWQGKIFHDGGTSAVNRFVGVPIIAGQVYQGTSWLDGRPSLILDYEHTSKVYRKYRDEIRLVGPGLYLGLMHDRTTPDHRLKMYFAFETERSSAFH